MGKRSMLMASVFKKLDLMVSAGVPLAEALRAILAGVDPGSPVHAALGRGIEELCRGRPFHEALAAHPRFFPQELVAIVRAGEEQGHLDLAISRIATGLAEGTLGPRGARGGLGPRGLPPPGPPPGLPVLPDFLRHGPQPPPAVPHPGDPMSLPPPPPGAAIEHFHELVRESLAENATDIHLEPSAEGGRVRFRVDGRLRERMRLDRHSFLRLVTHVKMGCSMDPGERRRPQERKTVLETPVGRLIIRAQSAPWLHGEGLTLRLTRPQDREIPLLDELGMMGGDLERVRRWLKRPYGLIAVAGPTASGKTTGLFSLVRSYDCESLKVVSIEQPAVVDLDGVVQLSLAPELGLTWSRAIELQLGHDPDVIMLGDVPSPEVVHLAFRAALTGHVVLGSFHADSPAILLERLGTMGLEPDVIRSGLVGILGQQLLRHLCHACRVPDPDPGRSFPAEWGPIPPGDYRRAGGCEACRGTGYRGRIAVFSLAEPSLALIEAIRRREPAAHLAGLLEEQGFASFRRDALARAARGDTSLDEVLRLSGGG